MKPRLPVELFSSFGGLLLTIIGGVLYLFVISDDNHICGNPYILLMVVGGFVVAVNCFSATTPITRAVKVVTGLLFFLVVGTDFLLHEDHRSIGQIAVIIFFGLALVFIPRYEIKKETLRKASIIAVSTLFAVLLVIVPLELILRSEYSQYNLFGPYGALPERLTPTANALGFRDIDHSVAKPEGITRILILGDSLTFGKGVADDEIYPRLLAEMAGSEIEIITIAQNGWSTADEYAAYQNIGAAYSPDIVIIGVVTNDIEAPGNEPSGQQPDWQIVSCFGFGLLTPKFIDYQLNRISDRLNLRYSYGRWENDLYAPESEYLADWREVVTDFGLLLKTQNVKGYAVLLASPRDTNDVELGRKYTFLADEFQLGGFEVLNLWPVYSEVYDGIPPRSLWALPNDSHPSAELHQFFAAEIWQKLNPDIAVMG